MDRESVRAFHIIIFASFDPVHICSQILRYRVIDHTLQTPCFISFIATCTLLLSPSSVKTRKEITTEQPNTEL